MFDWYVAALRRQRAQLESYRATITDRGVRGGSRWGLAPWVDTTKSRLADLDRRINELSAIIKAFERKYAA
jgi:hypothetical protein